MIYGDPETIQEIERLRRELAEAQDTLAVVLNTEGDHSPICTCRICRLASELAEAREDTALLDWADEAGHYDARYESLRDELRDRGGKLTTPDQPAANKPKCNPGIVCTHEGACHDDCGGDHYYRGRVCIRCGQLQPMTPDQPKPCICKPEPDHVFDPACPHPMHTVKSSGV